MGQNILELTPPKPDAQISYGVSPFQFGHLRVPEGAGPHPVAIVIHGGYWRAAYDLLHIGHLCEALRQKGCATWSLEYRRIGNPGGGYPGTFDDVLAGARHLESIAAAHRLDLRRVAVTGHSAGGHLALYLGIKQPLPLRGVVALAPVADLRRAFELELSHNAAQELIGGPPGKFPDRYRAASPIEMLPAHLPQRLLHGDADDVVPIELSRRYESAARAAGDDCRLIPLPGSGHFELIDPRTKQFAVVRDALFELIS